MPAAPKISQSKKAAAAKAKGATHSHTLCGALQKCDEERTDRDTCKTCDRLRLECLGFGAKRPEWLRENRNVVALREQIKASSRAIHGTGPRPADAGPQILRLSAAGEALQAAYNNHHSSDSESPPTRSLSLSDDDDRHRILTSSIRDQPADVEPAWFGPGGMNGYGNISGYSVYDDHHHHHQHPHHQHTHQQHHHLSANPYTLSSSSLSLDESLISPAIQSRFGRLYTEPITGFDLDVIASALPTDSRDPPFVLYQAPITYVPQGLVDDSVRTYVLRIAEIQYLLGDRTTLPTMIWESCQTHNNSQKALSLLTSIYYRRQQHPNQAVLANSEMHTQLRSLLDELGKGNFDDPDDAIAALHGVSMFLFDGGQGAWLQFLQLATEYVKKVLHSQAYGNPKDALLYASWKDAFIVKTSIWFDVLASITTGRPPHFLDEVRAMFNPNFPSVYDPSFDSSPQCSMMSPMGCENRIVWALAEVSALASWKDTEKAKKRLNIMELVQKATEIETYLYQKPFEPSMEPSEEKELEHIRYFASEIFRNATRLFLATVVNDDYPQVRKIQEIVDEVVLCFRNLFQQPGLDAYTVSRSVVRSTVFAIYISGAMSTNRTHREELLDHLDRESNGRNGEGVGNCASIRKMLEDVWKTVGANPSEPVPWRQILKEREILLV
ncbi:fungal-specific transcription factor domain-containing protein [Ephemerocybe angulata]|uniref:Fungal-specific transcription factor domain-containing protein n=1 Tax=Ephemerocybe angulata TaxID=980116 RepID=A0A8H6I6M1_9AGAR|nr:fungal-specific transcription factor domain-containing protein [Tulosesus angulatus]